MRVYRIFHHSISEYVLLIILWYIILYHHIIHLLFYTYVHIDFIPRLRASKSDASSGSAMAGAVAEAPGTLCDIKAEYRFRV